MAEAEKDTGWRGSRELWLDAALDALVEGGVSAVKVQPLGARLGLSRTSFYWFFENRAALLDACLERWETRNTAGLVAAAEAYAETPAEAMLNVIGAFLRPGVFDARLEFAVRGWALQSDVVMARVSAADEARLAALCRCLERFGYAAGDADVRARTIYLVQIGYISMQVTEDVETRLARVPGYVKIYSGEPPTESEMARFRAQIGVTAS